MSDIQSRIASGISFTLNAPVIAFFSFMFLIWFTSPPSAFNLLFLSTTFASILPTIILVCMASRGIIPDVFASDRRTRTKPFFGVLLSYCLGMVLLTLFGAPRSFIALMACCFVDSTILMLISLRWKISIHVSGVAGPVTFLVAQTGVTMLPLFMLLFPVAWARLKLKAHNLNQVLAGALLTVALTLGQVVIYL